ncbi:MAG: AAA family ATPase [Adlercreutzia equolifaciens]
MAPLAVRMRPRTLDEVVGQTEAVGEGSWLRAAIENDTLSSVILFGPAGTGKTSLAHVIAESTRATFVEVSSLGHGVRLAPGNRRGGEASVMGACVPSCSSMRSTASTAASRTRCCMRWKTGSWCSWAPPRKTLFRSELSPHLPLAHRGAALASDDEIAELVGRAVEDARGLDGCYALEEAATAAIVTLAGGDGRGALQRWSWPLVWWRRAQRPRFHHRGHGAGRHAHRALPYDKNKDMHYDIISAFIKSMRGSDPDAAVYWLARMIDGGEDPKFIARRMYIAASEDIGNADPQALLVAEAAFRAAEVIGYPECRINLAQAAIYLALAPKSNSAEAAIDAALREVRNGPVRKVPDYLATVIAPARKTTASTSTPTATRPAGSISAICPRP